MASAHTQYTCKYCRPTCSKTREYMYCFCVISSVSNKHATSAMLELEDSKLNKCNATSTQWLTSSSKMAYAQLWMVTDSHVV